MIIAHRFGEGQFGMRDAAQSGATPISAADRLCLLAVALIAVGVSVQPGRAQFGRAALTVNCRDANGRIAPLDASAGQRRIVLGIVSMPPAYVPQVARYGHEGWAYWSKVGVLIEAGNPAVRISVPKAWRKRAAIAWGVGGPLSELRFEACSPPPTYWNAFAGGFFLTTRSGCVPLLIQAGNRQTTVRTGVGRHC